ncbi:unannotated protein [freshwater metagenome]|uniref:Unannotated protein n=1 Tax=freshwater metagenome TaxID=449393 RepID=A0A6J7J0A0_9ZZZZ|nr:MMPL family transporter [Actinomycetota bacterium]
MIGGLLSAIMALAVRRPLMVAAGVLVLALGGGVLALRLEPSADIETLVGSSTPGFAATQELQRRFGDDAVYVVVREPVSEVVLTADLARVLGLEGCLSGNVPAGATPPGGRAGPCGRLARTRPAKVVFGPGTFLNTAVTQIGEQLTATVAAQQRKSAAAGNAAERLARAQGKTPQEAQQLAAQARKLVEAQFVRDLLAIALRYGITSAPRLDDPTFIQRLVFDPARPAGTPKTRFASIFPSSSGALIQVRLRSGLTEEQRRRAIADIRAAAAMPRWGLSKGDYAVTGAPVVIQELSRSISRSIIVLLGAALLIMALTLLLVFRARLRLLPLVVALAALALTFGLMELLGIALTMAAVAVIPILIGLAVDYAIQLQARLQETGLPLAAAAPTAARRGAPTIVLAAAATAAGFLILAASPVPMVRNFGILLVAGIAFALACALTLGVALQTLAERRAARRAAGGRARALIAPVAAAWRGAEAIVAGSRPWRFLRSAGRRTCARALRAALTRPAVTLAVAATLAVGGWALEPATRVESDIQRLVPQGLPALRDLQDLQRVSGIGGEVTVLIEGQNITDPKVVTWMTDYQRRILRALRYSEQAGCGRSDICPAFSLPDLFTTKASLASQERIEGLLDAVPAYFSQNVITPDRRAAALSFGLRLMPLERQLGVLQRMERELDPPVGVRARLAGLPVLAAQANDRIASPWRRLATLLGGLLLVAVVLLAALRSLRRALLPLVPIVLATGWAALAVFLTRIPLNPLSVMLSALVIAIATEFSVLLSERYRAERAGGYGVHDALQRTYSSTGAAVAASGVTAIAGFAVLIVSDIRMLRDFGIVTVLDLAVALVGVLLVLPAVLVLAERLPAVKRRQAAATSRGVPSA